VLAAGSPGSPDGPDGWPVERANAVNVAAPSSSSSCNASRPAFDVSVSARLLREDRRFSAELPNRVIQCNSVSRPRSRAPARPTTLPDQTNRISSISPGEASAASSRDASATVRTVSWGAWYIYCGGGAGRGGAGGGGGGGGFTARGGYPVTRPPDMTLPREPRFNFYGASIVPTRVATLPDSYVRHAAMCAYDAPATSIGGSADHNGPRRHLPPLSPRRRFA